MNTHSHFRPYKYHTTSRALTDTHTMYSVLWRELIFYLIRKCSQQIASWSQSPTYCVSDWVMVKFPADETRRLHKFSCLWHGPYRNSALNMLDVSVSKVYYPYNGGIQVHQSCIKLCPPNFPAGFYWYGGKRRGPGRPPKWVEQFLLIINKMKQLVLKMKKLVQKKKTQMIYLRKHETLSQTMDHHWVEEDD